MLQLRLMFVVAALGVAGTARAQNLAASADTPRRDTVWSLAAGVASGEGNAIHLGLASRREGTIVEGRLGYFDADASEPGQAGSITGFELAILGGVHARSGAGVAAARIGAGGIMKRQCVRNCGFFDPAGQVIETRRTIGLAYSFDAGVEVGGRRAVGLSAIVFGNVNAAHSFVSGGLKLSFIP